MKFHNVGKYPISIVGVGTVGPGEEFDCDRFPWDRQKNIARVDDPTKQGSRPTREQILALDSISELRDLLRPYDLTGRSHLALVEKALAHFSFAPLSAEEEEAI